MFLEFSVNYKIEVKRLSIRLRVQNHLMDSMDSNVSIIHRVVLNLSASDRGLRYEDWSCDNNRTGSGSKFGLRGYNNT